jgi:hypothetical protein
MKDTIANKIASFVATLNVADKSEFKSIWENQPPLAFTDGIAAVGAPASARSNRKALTGQLPDDVRAVELQFSVCDDFLPQFALASDIGRQFSDAWFAARQVIDLGRRAAKPNPPPPPKT